MINLAETFPWSNSVYFHPTPNLTSQTSNRTNPPVWKYWNNNGNINVLVLKDEFNSASESINKDKPDSIQIVSKSSIFDWH
jgi:hypothetical protein